MDADVAERAALAGMKIATLAYVLAQPQPIGSDAEENRDLEPMTCAAKEFENTFWVSQILTHVQSIYKS